MDCGHLKESVRAVADAMLINLVILGFMGLPDLKMKKKCERCR